MSTFESIVRPFLLPETAPPRVSAYTAPTQIPLNVKLQIGRIGATRTFTGKVDTSETVYVKKYPTEETTT